MSSNKERLSFRDFVPEISLDNKTRTKIHLSKYVRNRLRVYKRSQGLRSDSHAVHSLIVLNQMLLSIMQKIDGAIKTAKKREDPDYFIVSFYTEASPEEKAMWDLIWRGILL